MTQELLDRPVKPGDDRFGVSRPAQYPAAGNLAAKFFRIADQRHGPGRIGEATSKGCGKFPAPEGQGIIKAGAGKHFDAGREFTRSGKESATAP
jgi:hypothetical protein